MNKAKTTHNIALAVIITATFLTTLPRFPCVNGQLSPLPIPVRARAPAHASAPAPGPAPGPVTMMAPSPSLNCFSYLINVSDCLTYVDGGSNLTKPDHGCCPELLNLVNTQPICLCELLSNSSQLGITIDKNRALMLPSVCKINTPSVSLCSAIGVPVSVPTPSEGPSQGSPGSGNQDNGSPSNVASNQNLIVGFTILLFTCFY